MESWSRRLEITGESGGQVGPENQPGQFLVESTSTLDAFIEKFEDIGLPLHDAQVEEIVGACPL